MESCAVTEQDNDEGCMIDTSTADVNEREHNKRCKAMEV